MDLAPPPSLLYAALAQATIFLHPVILDSTFLDRPTLSVSRSKTMDMPNRLPWENNGFKKFIHSSLNIV